MKHRNTQRAHSWQRAVLTKPHAVLGTLAAAISACYAPHTFAQSGARQMDEVIVTARRKDEMAQEVPISMTVMTADFLENNNVAKIEDIGTKVPSLRISSLGGSRNEPVITLRGQRQGEAAFNQDPAAPLYFNEIVMAPIQGSNSGIYDLESLQVLKGPQGTLFGRNSTGGAIMMTPKRPGYKFGGYAEVKVGNYDLFGFEGAVDIPIVEALTTRLAAHKLDRDGYQKNIAENALNGKRYNDEHSEGARLSVNLEVGAFNNLTVLSYDEDKVAGSVPIASAINRQAGFIAASPIPANTLLRDWIAGVEEQVDRDDPWKIKSDIDGEEVVRNKFFSNTTEYEIIDDLSVKNVFGYRKVHFGYASDIDGTAAPVFGAYPSGGYAGTTDPIQTPQIDTEFYSNEFQFFGSAFDNNLDWITGLYWSKLAGSEKKMGQVTPPFTVFVNPPGIFVPRPAGFENAHNSIENTSYGLFVEGTYAFIDQLSLTLGARQSLEEREMTVRKFGDLAGTQCQIIAEGSASAAAPGCARTVDEDFDSTTWKASVNYTPTTKILVYGSVSTGFRAGGFNTRGTNDATLEAFDPENVLTYEIGTKQDWDIGNVPFRGNLAVFLQEYEDIQQTVSFTNATTSALETKTINAAKAEITGLELDLSIKPLDELTLAMSYSYVNAKYKERTDDIDFNGSRTVTGAEVAVDTSGNAFPYIPKQSATASVSYTLPLDASVGDITFMASAYWQEEMRSHPLFKQFDSFTWTDSTKEAAKKASTIDSYTIYNLRADWRSIMGSTFDAALYMDNVTNEEYVQGGLNVIESLGYTAYNYGAPRTFGASFKYSF